MMARFFEWFPFAALVCWGLLGVSRAVLFHSRGIPVVAIDRQRTCSEMAADLAAFACLLLWVWEIIAHAWTLPLHMPPAFLERTLVDSRAIKSAGVLLVIAALALYALALRDLGTSWRMGIDRSAPGPLITKGTYGWTRHPIYVAFDLMFLGVFFVLGQILFLALAILWAALLHTFMLREERFLQEQFGAPYRAYCRKVGRYFTLLR